jgi:amidase
MKECLLLFAAVTAAFCLIPSAQGETHKFTPTRFHNTFSSNHSPVLRIRPGDRVITRTIDAHGFDWENRKVAEPPNPQTGPVFVEGAEPGDVLVVRIEKIEPSRATAWSSTLLAPYAADPDFLRFEGLKQQVEETWNIDKQRGIAWLDSPMLGCVATAPERNQAIPTSTPDRFGGNMDYNGVVAGVKLMLPVFEPGALLFLGDGHGRQGDGEIVGNALETSMDVEFTVDVIKQKKIRWPRLENDEYIVVLGSASPLLQALQHATTEMQRWLMTDYGYDERGSSLLMGHMLEYDIANIVDPHFTVAAKMRKSCLPGSDR